MIEFIDKKNTSKSRRHAHGSTLVEVVQEATDRLADDLGLPTSVVLNHILWTLQAEVVTDQGGRD